MQACVTVGLRLGVAGWLWWVMVGLAPGTTNNLISNGSFESGLAGWITPGAPGVLYQPVSPAWQGSSALLVSNRTALTQGPAQSIAGGLLAQGNGARLAFRAGVQLATSAYVRAYLQLQDDTGSRPVILAERMVETTGTWVRVDGLRPITWQGALSNASLRFEIGAYAEAAFPPVLLDGLELIRDTDGDGLTDAEDAQPSTADANTNGIPDGWDAHYGLTNGATGADADGDGFTDRQEYWAATDPTNGASLPAQPVNPNATASARALLQYLALLPSFASNRVLVGQVVTETAKDYTNYVVALAAQTGAWPAMLGVVYDMISGPIDTPVINPHATNYWNAGGLVQVQWNPDNPFTGGFSGDTNGVNFPLLFTAGTTPHTRYLAYLDEVAAGLRELGDAGLVVLFRPLNECNSNNNWYQHQARRDYLALYRWTYDYLARTQALNHVLWMYDALNAPHQVIPFTYYYPGNDVVDIVGLNVYDDDWIPAFDLERLSRDYPKPLAIPEGGPLTILDGSFSNTVCMAAVTSLFPRLSLLCFYNSFTVGGVTKRYAMIDNQDAAGLLAHPWAVTRDELDWRRYQAPLVVEPHGTTYMFTLNWEGSHLDSSTDLYTWVSEPAAPKPFHRLLRDRPREFYRITP